MWSVGFGLAVLCAQVASAQVIGSVQLRLGESRERVFASLRQSYSVDSARASTDWWMVRERPKGDMIGTISFDQTGSLLYVDRVWPVQERASAATAAGTIIDALAELADTPNCTVVKKDQSGPIASLVNAVVSCGPHAVRISLVTRSAQPVDRISIEETWKR